MVHEASGLGRSVLVAVVIAGLVLTMSMVVPAVGDEVSDRAGAGATASKALKLAKTANKNAKKALKQSRGVTTRQTAVATIVGGGINVASLSLTAGSWVVTARVDGAHNGAAGSTRLECSLSGPDGAVVDFSKVRLAANVALDSLIFASVSLNGALTLASPGTVKVNCLSTAASPIDLTTRSMTAIKVAKLVTQ